MGSRFDLSVFEVLVSVLVAKSRWERGGGGEQKQGKGGEGKGRQGEARQEMS